jgi:hypothetical protein
MGIFWLNASPVGLLRPHAQSVFEDRTSGAAELAEECVKLVRMGATPTRVAALRPYVGRHGRVLQRTAH